MKKIFYTFLLISPLLFISSCEEEVQEENAIQESAYIEVNEINYPLDGVSKLLYYFIPSNSNLNDSILAINLQLLSSECSYHPLYEITCSCVECGANILCFSKFRFIRVEFEL